MKQIIFTGITPEDFQNDILKLFKAQFDELKREYSPKKPEEFLTRKETAKMLHVDESTLYNWNRRGVLSPVGIGARVYYRRTDIENCLVELKISKK
ncbi:helix-turn-helix domain-containing protein [Lutibacter sp.]|uniref:helix-turn-helix domain-containing protein n=1 Tax=Lutibacter sp. TaxID=1925666 RepID=UPI0035692261